MNPRLRVATAALLTVPVVVTACSSTAMTDTAAVEGGDPAIGRRLVVEHGCASCHLIPGIDRPTGRVGPPLGDFAGRRVVAGQLPNTPENAARWISEPQAVEPDTLMPDVGVTPQEALDIVAYLYSLD